MKSRILFGILLVSCAGAYAQSLRGLVHDGNDLYSGQQYGDAEARYREALERESGLVQGHFNLGDALYKQGKFDESVREFDQAATRADRDAVRAKALFNRGNAHLKAQRFEDAVRSYGEALKLAPDDQDAKYNLSYALQMMKRQQEQQQQQQKQDKNQKNDQQQQNPQQRQQQNKQQEQQQQQQQMAQQEKRMSKQDAERILEVLKNNEREVQKKLRARQTTRAKTERDW